MNLAQSLRSWDSKDDAMTRNMTLGLSVLAGVALIEAALIPGLVIGGAAVLAPKYLPKLRRGLQPLFTSTRRTSIKPAVRALDSLQDKMPLEVKMPPANPSGLAIKRALAKTVTYRVIVTTLDFSANYVVIGELATAAGLSAFALVAGPVFYFVHEIAWNKYRSSRITVDLPVLLPPWRDAKAVPAGERAFTIDRALAKTITFRTFATTMDFTTNYVVIGDLVAAAGLSAFGFVVGPFIYLAHEKVWDRFGSPEAGTAAPPTPVKSAPIRR
jgi:uncharacterized membrane protein